MTLLKTNAPPSNSGGASYFEEARGGQDGLGLLGRRRVATFEHLPTTSLDQFIELRFLFSSKQRGKLRSHILSSLHQLPAQFLCARPTVSRQSAVASLLH